MLSVHRSSSEQWMRVLDARRALDVSEWTVYRWIQAGKLRAIRPGHRWLVLREDVENMLKFAS